MLEYVMPDTGVETTQSSAAFKESFLKRAAAIDIKLRENNSVSPIPVDLSGIQKNQYRLVENRLAFDGIVDDKREVIKWDPGKLAAGVVNAEPKDDGNLLITYPHLDNGEPPTLLAKTEFTVTRELARSLVEIHFNLNNQTAEGVRMANEALTRVYKKTKPIELTEEQVEYAKVTEDLKFFEKVEKTWGNADGNRTARLDFTEYNGRKWSCDAETLVTLLLATDSNPNKFVKFEISQPNDIVELRGEPLTRNVELTIPDIYRVLSTYMELGKHPSNLSDGERKLLLKGSRYLGAYIDKGVPIKSETKSYANKIRLTTLSGYGIGRDRKTKVVTLTKDNKTFTIAASELETAILNSTQPGESIDFSTEADGPEADSGKSLLSFQIDPSVAAFLLGYSQYTLHDNLESLESLLKKRFSFPANFRNNYENSRKAFNSISANKSQYNRVQPEPQSEPAKLAA